MYVPVQLAGGTYRHKDLSLTAQTTRNFHAQRQQAGNEKSPFIIESFYGWKPFASNSDGSDRGMFEHKGILYKLNGTTLSSVDNVGTFTSLGTIPGGGRAVFDGLGDSVVIAADGIAYQWDGSTLTTGTDADFESPNTVTVINNQAIYDGDDDRFGVSDVGLPLTINALNYGTAEFKADNLRRPYAFGTIVYMFGDKTIEQFWNDTSVSDPPFSPIQDGTLFIGLGATQSVANDDEQVYLFADDNQVYALSASVPIPLLPSVIVREITGYNATTDAIGWTMQLDGQWYYVLKFPTADKTWIYPKGGEWFELSSGVTGGRYLGNSFARAYGRNLIADEGGDIFELDIDTFDEDGRTIRRVRTLAPISGSNFNQPGRPIEVKFLKLIGKTGTGQGAGQGANPEIILEYSDDGENWSTEIRAKVGKLNVMTEIIFEINDTLETWIFRLTSTDPVYSNWHEAGLEMEVGLV